MGPPQRDGGRGGRTHRCIARPAATVTDHPTRHGAVMTLNDAFACTLVALTVGAAGCDRPTLESRSESMTPLAVRHWRGPLWEHNGGWRIGAVAAPAPKPRETAVASFAAAAGTKVLGAFADGTILVQLLVRQKPTEPGPLTHRLEYWRYRDSGASIMRFTSVDLAGRFVNRDGRVSSYVVPLVTEPDTVAVGNRLWVRHGSDPCVDSFTTSGTATRYCWALARQPAARTVAEAKKAVERLPPADRDVLVSMPMPVQLPAYQSMLADDEGHLWLERYRVRSEDTAERIWDVIRPSDGWLGSVRIPKELTLTQVSSRTVTAWRTDPVTGVRERHAYELITRQTP